MFRFIFRPSVLLSRSRGVVDGVFEPLDHMQISRAIQVADNFFYYSYVESLIVPVTFRETEPRDFTTITVCGLMYVLANIPAAIDSLSDFLSTRRTATPLARSGLWLRALQKIQRTHVERLEK